MISLSTISSLLDLSAKYWIFPSKFLSSKLIKPVVSQFLNQLGTLEYSTFDKVSIIFVLAKTATAGAVVYSTAIRSNAIPADFLASETFLTVKNLIITCGRPAVPTIKANVMAKTSINGFVLSVYLLNPNCSFKPSNLSRRYPPSIASDPNPNCGIGFPVICIEMKIAGTIKAKIKTQY